MSMSAAFTASEPLWVCVAEQRPYRLHFYPPPSFLTSVDSGLGSLASGFPGQAEVVRENGTIMS